MPGLTVRISLKGLIRYLRENWGAPFISAFMFLLMAAAVHQAENLEAVANDLAIYAYYMLVVGVALQLAAFIKEERSKKHTLGLVNDE